MELEDLKKEWELAIHQTNKKHFLTSKIITDMLQTKYQSRIKKIKYPEFIGGTICVLGLGYIVFSFNKLDTIFLQAIGVLAISLLLAMPILSFLSLIQFKSSDNFNKPYIEAIKQFANHKLRFLKYQKINAFLSCLLLVTIIILLPKFFYQKDITLNKNFWIFSFSGGYIFLLLAMKWVKKSYGNSLRQAEELLKEIET